MGRLSPIRVMLNAVGANGSGTEIDVSDDEIVVLEIGSSNNADLVVKIQGSIMKEPPDWDGAQSVDNHFTNLGSIDLDQMTPIDGNVGVVFSGTDLFKHLELNVNGMRWINVIVSGYVAGKVTSRALLFSAQV